MSSGWAGLAQSISKLGQQRRERGDEELHANTGAILEDVKRLQDRRASLPAGDPGLKDIDDSLAEHQRVFTDLIRRNKVNPDQISSLLSSAAGTAPKDPNLTPEELKKRARIAAGIEPQATAPKPEAENWVPSDVTFADGSRQTLQRNTKSGKWTDLAGNPVSPDKLATATVAPKAGKNIRAWKNVNGKITSVLLDPATNKEIPGSENSSIQPPSTMTGKISTGFYHFVDENGAVHQVQETRTSMPAGRGGATNPSASVAKTPAEAKDKILGHHLTAPQAKAKTEYNEAVKLSSQADLVAQHPNDAVNQKRLAVALERVSAGRFTTQALDYIIKAGWGNTIEQWANNPSTGALPPDIMRQLVDGAHQNLKASKDAMDTAMGTSSNVSDDDFLKKF